jgi:hypothetical protein
VIINTRWNVVAKEGLVIQLLCFCTSSIVLFLFKAHSVLETGFYLRLQVEPTQLAEPIELVPIAGPRD